MAASSFALLEPLARDGFAFVQAPQMYEALAAEGFADWDAFAKSWNDLGVDTYMADGGRYRKRRFATFAVSATSLARKPHQPHYQSRDYNALNGGIARWFLPIEDHVATHPALQAILRLTERWFVSLTPEETRPDVWHVEVHQFRIETGVEQGLATPEGMHRDGVDWVLVMLVRRENIVSGETLMEDANHHRIGSFTLTAPLDSALCDDDRVFHAVTPIERIDETKPAYRDVLVVTFRR